MIPFIRDEDYVIIRPVNHVSDLRVGTIAAVPGSTDNKQIMIHRIVRVKGKSLLLKGDNLVFFDGWFDQNEVIGIVEKIIKKDHTIYQLSPILNRLIAVGSRTRVLNHIISAAGKVKRLLHG